MSQSAISPLDVLADELGAAAGRIERELRNGFEAAIARLDARIASIELAALRAENERELRFVARLAELKDGKDGQDGKDGIDGKDGLPGRDGVNGKDGAAGRDGLDGSAGEKGDRGEAGQPGKLPVVKAWTARVHYEGDIVTRDGSTYQAVRDTGGQPPGGDWELLAGRGADGLGFSIKGTYDPTISYKQNDVVSINGSSFAAKKDNPGPFEGGNDWQLVAGVGKRGDKGERGHKGEKGDRGKKGASIIAGKIEPDIMALDLIDSDGQQVSLDLVPLAQAIVAK